MIIEDKSFPIVKQCYFADNRKFVLAIHADDGGIQTTLDDMPCIHGSIRDLDDQIIVEMDTKFKIPDQIKLNSSDENKIYKIKIESYEVPF